MFCLSVMAYRHGYQPKATGLEVLAVRRLYRVGMSVGQFPHSHPTCQCRGEFYFAEHAQESRRRKGYQERLYSITHRFFSIVGELRHWYPST